MSPAKAARKIFRKPLKTLHKAEKEHNRRRILAELKTLFPHLKDEIESAQNAIFHAHSMAHRHRSSTKSEKQKAHREISGLAKAGLLPSQIAHHFLDILLEPWEDAGGMAEDVEIPGSGEVVRQEKDEEFRVTDKRRNFMEEKAGEAKEKPKGKPEYTEVEFRAFWRHKPSVKGTGYAGKEIPATIYIMTSVRNPSWDAQYEFVPDLGYKIGVTPFTMPLPVGETFDFLADYEGMGGQFEKRVKPRKIKKIEKSEKISFFFDIIAAGGGAVAGGVGEEFTLHIGYSPAGSGDTVPDKGAYKFTKGSVVTCQAMAAPNYIFNRWELDGSRKTDMPLSIVMGKNRTAIAFFDEVPKPPAKKQFYLAIRCLPEDAGSTSPAQGTYTLEENESVDCSAISAEGFIFEEWFLDGAPVGTDPKNYKVKMNKNHTLVAKFKHPPKPKVVTFFYQPAPQQNQKGGTDYPGEMKVTDKYGRENIVDHDEKRDYAENDDIKVSASPNEGWRFVKLVIQAQGYKIHEEKTNKFGYPVKTNTTIYAVFEKLKPGEEYFPVERGWEKRGPKPSPRVVSAYSPATRRRWTHARRILRKRANDYYNRKSMPTRVAFQLLKKKRKQLDDQQKKLNKLLRKHKRQKAVENISAIMSSVAPESKVAMIAASAVAYVKSKSHVDGGALEKMFKDFERELQEYSQDRRKSDDDLDRFEKEMRDFLLFQIDGIIAEFRITEKESGTDELYKMRGILTADAANLASVYSYRLRGMYGKMLGAGTGYGMAGAGAMGGRTQDVLKNIITQWWGVWLWPLLNFLVPPLGWFALIAWALLKIPIASSVIVLWLQVAFVIGGTVLGIASLPGYTTPTTFTTLLVLGLIGGFLNWMLNMRTDVPVGSVFEGTPFGEIIKQLSHIVAGFIIFLGVGMLTLALQLGLPSLAGIAAMAAFIMLFSMLLPPEYLSMLIIILVILSAFPVFGGGAATAVFGIFVIMGMTNFYPVSGLSGLNLIAIGILVFSYFALGPYSSTIIETMGQIKAPVTYAMNQAKMAFKDIWMLITNPTAYYQQQQLRQVQAEQPLSFPEGIEITQINKVPEGTVAAGQPFVVYAVIENKAEQVAKNVVVAVACIPGTPSSAKCSVTSPAGPVNCGISAGATATLGGVSDISRYCFSELKPHEAKQLQFSFKSGHSTDAYGTGQSRAAETVFNKVNLSMAYTYDTASRLQVEVADEDEVMRRQLNKEPVFIPVPAVGKVGPAQLSLYVGPQPLVTSTIPDAQRKTMVAAVSNARPDGEIVVYRSIEWNIMLSEDLGTDLKCGANCRQNINDNKKTSCTFSREDTVAAAAAASPGSAASGGTMTPGAAIEKLMYFGAGAPGEQTGDIHIIRPYKLKDYWVQVCDFMPKSVQGSRTGIITSTLDDYIVHITKEISMAVGPPLGILGAEKPVAPVLKSATVVTGITTSVKLEWEDRSGNEAGFRIYRKLSTAIIFDKISDVNREEIKYTDSSGNAGHTYKVCAYNDAGESCSSEMTA